MDIYMDIDIHGKLKN